MNIIKTRYPPTQPPPAPTYICIEDSLAPTTTGTNNPNDIIQEEFNSAYITDDNDDASTMTIANNAINTITMKIIEE